MVVEETLRVLIVEDNIDELKLIKTVVVNAGFDCVTAETGADALHHASRSDFDAILLDLNLPDINGDVVLERLRLSGNLTPLLVLSGTGDVETRISLLAQGADDFVTKPFNRRELLARLSAVIRRARGLSRPTIEFKGLYINFDAKSVMVYGQPVELTGREYAVLTLLAARMGSIVSDEEILNSIYEPGEDVSPQIVKVYVSHLRKKLQNSSGGETFIETVWGRGYRLGSADEADGGMSRQSKAV